MRWLTLLPLACVGCLDDNVVVCSDGTVCPTSQVCDPRGGCVGQLWSATPVLGGGLQALELGLAVPTGVAVDRDGTVYFCELEDPVVRRIERDGTTTIVAGNGTFGASGDGGPATAAQLTLPTYLAFDSVGNLFISDTSNHRVRRVDAVTGIITTVAGTGVAGTPDDNGDGGLALAARLSNPLGLAVDGFGNLFIADLGTKRVRKVDVATGIISRFGPVASAPAGVAIDAERNVYATDMDVAVAARITEQDEFFIIASAADGLSAPVGLVVDSVGNVFVSDLASHIVVRADAVTGAVTQFAGQTGQPGFAGDGGPPSDARVFHPAGLAVDRDDGLYVADSANARVRRMSDDVITTIAGSGVAGSHGDTGAATSAFLLAPRGVALDSAGRLLVADTAHGRIRRVEGNGVITTVVGTGTFNPVLAQDGDGGPGTRAVLSSPSSIAVDANDNIFIADTGRHRIRRYDAVTQTISTVAGIVLPPSGMGGFDDDTPRLATDAKLDRPTSIAVDSAGNLYIADTNNNRVRRVDTNGVITTVLLPTETTAPLGLAVDGTNNLYIADSGRHRVQRRTPTGTLTVLAGNGTSGKSDEGVPAITADLDTPVGVTVDVGGNVYIAEAGNHRVRVIRSGVITTLVNVAGVLGRNGDGGMALDASAGSLGELVVDAQRNLYFADQGVRRVRRVDATTQRITTVIGDTAPDGMGPLAQGRFSDPHALVVTPAFTMIAGGTSGTIQRADSFGFSTVAGRYPQGIATGVLALFRTSSFGDVDGLAFDPLGKLYVSESSGVHAIDIVDPDDTTTWTITQLAVPALRPTGLHLDPAGTLLVADFANHTLLAHDPVTNTSQIIAGTAATRGFDGDGSAALGAQLSSPEAVTRCPNGDIFIADTGNHRVRRIVDNTITTVLGNGSASSSGDGTPSRSFAVNGPRGLACDSAGNVFVTSTTSVRLLQANANGDVDGGGEVLTIYGRSGVEAFPETATRCLTGVAVIDDTTVQIADACIGMIVELRRILQ